MRRFLSLLAVTSLILIACSNSNHPISDVRTTLTVTAAIKPTTSVQPAATKVSGYGEQCITERPIALWEMKGAALEEAVRCIEELPSHWWEEEEAVLVWESKSKEAQYGELLIASDGKMGIGCCDGLFMPLQLRWYQGEVWTDIQARFASFQYETEEERVIFKGKGEIISPAWQRAIATWARATGGELYTGGACASCGTALSWNLGQVPGKPGYCAMLVVLDIGKASTHIARCEGAESDLPGSEIKPVIAWLTMGEWERFDAWLYGQASVHCQDDGHSYFAGQGSQQMGSDELLELSNWVKSVYARLISSRSDWPNLPDPDPFCD